MNDDLYISSTKNTRVKEIVKMRKRSFRDELGVLVVEGYRAVRRALDNNWPMQQLFVCPGLFLGSNEADLIEDARKRGAEIFNCSEDVFCKMAYRERPEGILGIAPRIGQKLDELPAQDHPLYLIGESIEKPGNLGTMLRSSDATGVDAVVVCDRCTDLNNPNVVRASVGTLFTVPVIEAGTPETIAWMRGHGVQTIAATPSATDCYTDIDLTKPSAIVVGSEQYGLHEEWMKEADVQVVIPMLGKADSLNVAAAATILLYEAVRQRQLAGIEPHT